MSFTATGLNHRTSPIELRERPPSRRPLEEVLERFAGLRDFFGIEPPPRERLEIRDPRL